MRLSIVEITKANYLELAAQEIRAANVIFESHCDIDNVLPTLQWQNRAVTWGSFRKCYWSTNVFKQWLIATTATDKYKIMQDSELIVR